ncbi:MAG TPA: protein translocase subunit SecD [Solirubrobacteraceae bacterium]|nr:protein translocase subunit SecD [Solirubrobacteraceae bacterium]
MTDRQRNGFILLLVLGLLVVSGVIMTQDKTRLGLDLKGGVELTYQAEPTVQTPKVTPDALQHAVDIMRSRVDQIGVSEPDIRTSGGSIVAALPDVQDISRAERIVGTTAQMAFYDWEANLIIPGSKPLITVAQGLKTQDQTAIEMSQGSGAPGAGSQSLYDAVKLASQQPPQASSDNSHTLPIYYLFGTPGSPACAAAAKFYGVPNVVGAHCLLSGPDDNTTDLYTGLPTGVTKAEAQSSGQVLAVPRGTVVLQAANASATKKVSFEDPSAQFYVLHDHVALFGNEISNPQQSTDPNTGEPDVTFGFNGKGKNEFQKITAAIALRGELVSTGTTQLKQHFAVALDNQLVTVPLIDYKLYPDGIPGDTGADITGGFTIQQAQDLATQLRLGALPVKLKLISSSQVSATLGKQALNQGLLAGLAGLLIVVIFLLVYYRVLGAIATVGLIVYGAYFYALIKLIPITLTLPGIAGLILTIGVAADANIVIFERVKEEIRAGRSIRQGIAIGYRKGLTAIIDANVVTIITAFILFVLATADVQGFAFTLGIGTFVSLFTAVMATQAILTSMGSSRLIASPSALGAGGKKRVWRFDFMGASRYFFSMSGVILLVGALAIGGRGLNLGIDFTSGTRVTLGLQHAATEAQVRSIVSAAGGTDAIIQRVSGDPTLGPYGFQIESKKLQPSSVTQVRTNLDTRFGLRANTTGGQDFSFSSVGPSFGKTVANSALVAIIASLVVISVYVALRFEWKFAVPVLIALMHDLLITSGVYSLTGREVTTATVAALLTILGYSLYDTIIVFDRVRENIPRMPRAAFSQIVNRSMSEVLTRSLATTSCTLLPILSLLLFGGSTLQDFAFALLIGVASGAYSSIFIASPVLTHWKEREAGFRHRRERIEEEFGHVPAYASAAADIEPEARRPRRAGRLTAPEPEGVSAAEFEQMKRELGLEEERRAARQTSTLTKRLSHSPEAEAPQRDQTADGGDGAAREVTPAPDIAENEGVAPTAPSKRSPKGRNRRHGRRR